jgi:hypothetical protein
MPKQSRKARRLVVRVAEPTLDVTLEHDRKIIGQPTRTPCVSQLRFKAIEVSMSGTSDFFAQQLRPSPTGGRIGYHRQ